jgi:hypothetical protein
MTIPIWHSPKPEGPGPCIYIPQEWYGPAIPQALGSLLVTSYDYQGYSGGIQTCLHARGAKLSQSYFRLAVYCPSAILASSPLQHTIRDFFSNWTLMVIVLIQRLLWREDSFASYEYACPIIKCMYCTYRLLLKILLFALSTSPLSVQALKNRLGQPYISDATTAA